MVNQEDKLKKPINTKVAYEYIKKETLADVINKSFPEQLVPDKKMAPILGLIFLAVVIIGLFQFPYGSLMTGNLDIVINIGYPWPFLVLDLSNSDESPARVINLVLDLFLYLILAYAINIVLNLVLKNSFVKSKEESQKQPAVFKDRKPTIAEEVTEKVVKNIEK